MDLFSLIRGPHPAEVKTGTRPRLAHEVPLLEHIAGRVIAMDIPAGTSESAGTSSTLAKSLLDFDNEEPPAQMTNEDGTEVPAQEEVVPPGTSAEIPPTTRVVAEPVPKEGGIVTKKWKQLRRKRKAKEVEANAPAKVLRRDHHSVRPEDHAHPEETIGGTGVGEGSTAPIPEITGTPTGSKNISDPDPLSCAKPAPIPKQGAGGAPNPNSKKSSSFASMSGSPGEIYQPGWGITNNFRLDTPGVCQEVVDHIVPPGYFLELRHLPNEEFLNQYNINLAWQVAMGSQLRLRFEQEARLLRKAKAQVSKRDQRIQVKEVEITQRDQQIQSLKAVEGEVNNQSLSQQVSTLQAQVTGEEQIKAAFEEFKKSEHEKVEQRCAKMDARLDALSIDFDEELYPHMLTVIAGRRWVIGQGLRLAVMKCAESLELRQAFAVVVSAGIAKGFCDGIQHAVEQGKEKLELHDIKAYDPESEGKFVAAMQALKDLNDTGEDAPQLIRDLRPSSSQLKIPVYSKVHDPRNPWVVKEEVLLANAIAANKSRAEKKKKCRVVCHTHGVGSAHHPRLDGIPVSAPTVPQGLQILLQDVAIQTEPTEDGSSPRLIRSKSLPSMYNLDWP
ncbi:hypothetical protein Tco_0344115 [Tanacetum coccineum]